MSIRPVKRLIKSKPTLEGAGVHLRRAFGFGATSEFDPFLLLDDFRNEIPADYLAGFPWHPHRGIETITYVLAGTVEHGDSLGHSGAISAGDVQWMTAGSGIIHQEMPKGDPTGRMHGFQLWANFPASLKMTAPRYQEVHTGDIPIIKDDDGTEVRIVCGKFWGKRGPVDGIAADPIYLDVTVPPGHRKTLPVETTRHAFAYVFAGAGKFCNASEPLAVPTESVGWLDTTPPSEAENRSLILFDRGDEVVIHPEFPEPELLYDQPGPIVICRLGELRRHPSYVRLGLSVPASKLSALDGQGELAFREPLAITYERIVIDGYARLELARLRTRLALPCLEYALTEEEALRWLLQKQRRSNRMNAFCRILLALELEPHLKAKGLSNQRFGGKMKGSSNLPEAATVDVRKKIAAAAGVSTGNVNKVKQLVRIGQPELLEALRGDEVSIHRAWKWSGKSPEQQIEALRTHQAERGVNKSIRDMISRQKQTQTPTSPNLGSLARQLSELEPHESNSVSVSVIRAPGKRLFVTEELIQFLGPYQESMSLCTPDNR